jgi:Helix-turn-helix domain
MASDRGARLIGSGFLIPAWQVPAAALVIRAGVEKRRADGVKLTAAEAQFLDAFALCADTLAGVSTDTTADLDRADVIASAVGVDTAAASLGYSAERVRQLARDGALGGTQIGKTWVFDPAEIEAYAAGRDREKRPDAA